MLTVPRISMLLTVESLGIVHCSNGSTAPLQSLNDARVEFVRINAIDSSSDMAERAFFSHVEEPMTFLMLSTLA